MNKTQCFDLAYRLRCDVWKCLLLCRLRYDCQVTGENLLRASAQSQISLQGDLTVLHFIISLLDI